MIVVSLLLILVAVTLLVLGLTGGSSGLLISSIVASLVAAVFLVIGARQAAGARRAASAAPDEEPLPPASVDENSVYVAEPEFAAAADAAQSYDDQRDTVQFDPSDVAAARPSAGPDFVAASESPAPSSADQPGAVPAGDLSADDIGRRDPAAAEADDPDYDRASAAINAARSEAPGDEPDEFDEPDADDPDDEPLPQSVQPADAVRVARLDAEVLVVDGRPRYHLSDCPSLVGRLTEPIPVGEAVELGFSPCGLCRTGRPPGGRRGPPLIRKGTGSRRKGHPAVSGARRHRSAQ